MFASTCKSSSTNRRSPAGSARRWFYRGREVAAQSPRDLRGEVSRMMCRVFPKTPHINNEMVVRKRPSPVVVNARKKLVLGILERHGQEEMGIQGIFPTSRCSAPSCCTRDCTSRIENGRWGFAAPQAVADPGLQSVCEAARIPDRSCRCAEDIAKFLDELVAPPYGVRAGLLPVLFAAGLKAFPMLSR